MDGRLFTFLGLVSHDHDFIIASHTILVAIIAIILAKLATSKLQVVPGTMQNIFEAFFGWGYFYGKRCDWRGESTQIFASYCNNRTFCMFG